jgi:hypothetical protein
MTTKKIDMVLDPMESDSVELEVSENTDKITVIGNSEDVDNEDIEVVVGWFVEGTRVGGESSKNLSESPFKLEPVADLLKIQLRNENSSKSTKINGAVREKKRG